MSRLQYRFSRVPVSRDGSNSPAQEMLAVEVESVFDIDDLTLSSADSMGFVIPAPRFIAEAFCVNTIHGTEVFISTGLNYGSSMSGVPYILLDKPEDFPVWAIFTMTEVDWLRCR